MKWIGSHADACAALGKPFVLEEFGKNVTVKAKTPEDWKAMRTPMFARAYSEYISSLESGGNYQGARLFGSPSVRTPRLAPAVCANPCLRAPTPSTSPAWSPAATTKARA